ncbi:MAG: 50S ribosomal protein L25 [Candidatus Omnitrophica bacterium]|nr:50S ribosomal protein L25 [Candidatus Omnitrophota bacterium]MDD5352871.1 50S ribosomal protein L25 [Candidatus Omnitrophota bacterium]MDD5550470.1 50S ribosomal protein L25 [Candidatus Omnitrophota bacterium]
MEKVYLDCLPREEVGKNKVNALRRTGFVPAVVYGEGAKSIAIKIDRSQLIKFIHTHHGVENMIITLRFAGKEKSKDHQEEKSVLIKEMQFHPVQENILHVDFNEISLTKAIVIKVPVRPKGEAIGVKQEGGVLTHVLWELEVECLPTAIPEKVEVDISNMKIGDTIQVKDLTVPEGAKVLTTQDTIVFTLMAPKKEEIVTEVPEGAAPTEPEVIKKEKAEAEEGEEKEGKEEEKKEEKKQEKKPQEGAPGKK